MNGSCTSEREPAKGVVEVLVAAGREKLQLSVPSKRFGWVSLEQAPTGERKPCVCCRLLWRENNDSSRRKEKYHIYWRHHQIRTLSVFAHRR
jgi:hypothetical protein